MYGCFDERDQTRATVPHVYTKRLSNPFNQEERRGGEKCSAWPGNCVGISESTCSLPRKDLREAKMSLWQMPRVKVVVSKRQGRNGRFLPAGIEEKSTKTKKGELCQRPSALLNKLSYQIYVTAKPTIQRLSPTWQVSTLSLFLFLRHLQHRKAPPDGDAQPRECKARPKPGAEAGVLQVVVVALLLCRWL